MGFFDFGILGFLFWFYRFEYWVLFRLCGLRRLITFYSVGTFWFYFDCLLLTIVFDF